MPRHKLHFQRFEMKYQIPLDIVEGLLPELLKYMDFDPYAKNLPGQAYKVASLYYDSVGLDCYYQKIAGIKTRKKIRIRFYPSSIVPETEASLSETTLKAETPVFLEVKKKYDMVVIKDRLALDYKNCYNLLIQNNFDLLNKSYSVESAFDPYKSTSSNGLNELHADKTDNKLSQGEQETLDEFLWLKLYNSMLPQNMVIYERKPLISKVDPGFRVTIDYNLHTFLSNWLKLKNREKLVNPQGAILEVKFNNIMPFWFQNIIQRYGLEHRPFSKYCQCLEICRPELAAKKFVEVYQNKNYDKNYA